jgi:hypothetical protein
MNYLLLTTYQIRSQHTNSYFIVLGNIAAIIFKELLLLPLLLLLLSLDGAEEGAAHETPLGQGERVKPLPPREAQAGHHGADRVHGRPHVQEDRHGAVAFVCETGWLHAPASVEIDDVAHLFSVLAFHEPIVAVKRLGIPVGKCVRKRGEICNIESK